MAMQIYNTLSRTKEAFEPIEPGHVRLYTCGPTVYDLSHMGHARTYVAFDTVVRFLRRHYKVTYVRNYTDVDDKIIKRSNEKGETCAVLSERFIDAFAQDLHALGCLPADIEPKVTEHVPQVLSMVERLVANGAAYPAHGDVYFAVEKFATYGKLGRRSLEDMEAGARVEVSEQKRHPMDFVLWKTAKPGEPSWDSPWGKGRPGWHIECSAMAKEYFGDTFDIHGGGRDLIFPHHENEIAQSEAASQKQFARVWMHGGLVNIDNEKMSKSLGNFFTIREVLEKFDPQTVRFSLLSTHYRSPINFSDATLREAEQRIKYFYDTLLRLRAALKPGPAEGPHREAWVGEIVARFDAAMQDDFNTPQAIGDLSEVFKLVNDILARPADAEVDARTLRAIDAALRDVGGTLGIFLEDPPSVLARIEKRKQAQRGVDASKVQQLIEARTQARKDKNFARADEIRKQLADLGVVIKDSPQGTTWEVA